jgi:magnesium chelatase family protein
MRCNADAQGAILDSLSEMSPSAKALLSQAADRLKLSARSWFRTLRVARTIADLSGGEAEPLQTPHITEALSYRRLRLTDL